MSKQTLVWMGLVVILSIVSGILWSQLRAQRQLTFDLGARLAEKEASYAEAAHLEVSRSLVDGGTPVGGVQPPKPEPVVVVPASAPPPPLRIPLMPTQDAPEPDTYQQSDMTARARAMAWMRSLAAAGRALTPDQMQALMEAAVHQMRRETDEETALARNAPLRNSHDEAQAKLEYIDRQHATNLRILDAVTPKLTARQLAGLRTQFESWHAGAKASARVELERAAADF